MDRLISCEFNMDNACVELKFLDGSMIAIDTIAVENEVADNMYQRSELDYLIYNDPIGYADLILNGNPFSNLRNLLYIIDLIWDITLDEISALCLFIGRGPFFA